MNYNHELANKVREALQHLPKVEEKEMFNGLTFMVDDKMCIGVRETELMFRVSPEDGLMLVERHGIRPMIHGKRTMKGYIFAAPEAYRRKEDFDELVALALNFNPLAKSSKKK